MHEDTIATLAGQSVVTIHKFTGRHTNKVRTETKLRHTAAKVIRLVTTASRTEGKTHRHG